MKKCIDSILKQNYPKNRYKIFVVDAFSDDGTYEILKRYGRKITLKQLKGFPPTAYNYAIRRIKTDLIAFTNADCVAHKNWLREITKPFDEKEVVAAAGIAINPPKLENKLQEVIGIELEDRYNNFPKEISRAPEMNLCVKTKLLKKLKFDETMAVSYDADFGYRATEYGKIIYNPKAIIYHYHRASWKSLFKQQKTYANYVPITYLKKHRNKIRGDHISKTSMLIQIILLYISVASALLGFFLPNFTVLFYISTIILFATYLIPAVKLCRTVGEIPWFLSLFFVRNVAWNTGLISGLFNLLFR